MREEFGKHVAEAQTLWLEPPWKMLLSNKGILPILWDLFPRHPYLLESKFDGPGLMMSWAKKPMLGREGANILLHQPGKDVETGGEYGDGGCIFQQMASLKSFDGKYPVIGSWLIGHEEGNVPAVWGFANRTPRLRPIPASSCPTCSTDLIPQPSPRSAHKIEK